MWVWGEERQARCRMERRSSVGRRGKGGKVDMVDTWGGVRLSLGVGDGGGGSGGIVRFVGAGGVSGRGGMLFLCRQIDCGGWQG